jgi:hypothetical protein
MVALPTTTRPDLQWDFQALTHSVFDVSENGWECDE